MFPCFHVVWESAATPYHAATSFFVLKYLVEAFPLSTLLPMGNYLVKGEP